MFGTVSSENIAGKIILFIRLIYLKFKKRIERNQTKTDKKKERKIDKRSSG